MAVNFLCDGEKMKEIHTNLEEVHTLLVSSYQKAKIIFEEIQSKENWEGESQQVMETYLDILLQYHSALSEVGGPVEQACEGLLEFEKNLCEFYKNWEEYKKLGEEGA